MSIPLRRPAGARRRPRRLVWSALVAALAAVALSAVPGTAMADPPTNSPNSAKVTPILDCYFPQSDGSYIVVLGYTSTYGGTKSIPIGSSNNTYPSSYQPQMPTQFKAGTWHGVTTVSLPASVLDSNPYWYLDGTRLDYRAAAYASGICSSSQLPALANGAAMTLGLLAAGGAGYVMVRKARRPVAVAAADTAGDEPDRA